VFFLVPEVATCGDAAPARTLATVLPPDQFRVTVGVLGPATGSTVEELRATGIPVHSVPIRNAIDFGGMKRLRQTVREAGPAVIHAWGASAARAARLLVKRHRDEGNTPRLVVSGATATGGGLTGWLCARQIRRADRVIPTTRTDGERYRRLGVPAEQLTLIAPAAPAMIPTPNREAFCRELGIPPRARLIVTGGRSEAGVGPKDAIVAFDMLRYDAKDLYLVVFGAGPETAALEQFGRKLAFDDFRVRFAPCPPNRAAAARLADAAFVTNPRGIEEALEAMAAGKPVVGWQTPDLAEIVADKSTGVLVPLGDRAALAASTRSVLENPDYARRLGEAGRARAAERFGVTRMIEQFARLYQELAPANGPA
jgi:glycosyltransferase involved in cell wall biosynthesis